jgi:hypothetical protein
VRAQRSTRKIAIGGILDHVGVLIRDRDAKFTGVFDEILRERRHLKSYCHPDGEDDDRGAAASVELVRISRARR